MKLIPSDTQDFAYTVPAFLVRGGGTLRVKLADGTDAKLAVVSGQALALPVLRIYATGTTATGLETLAMVCDWATASIPCPYAPPVPPSPPPPVVTAVTVNGGAVQRSRVTTVTVVLDSLVNQKLVTSAKAFTLVQFDTKFPAFTLTNAVGGGIATAVAIVGGHTEVTLTFTGTTGVEFGSLADGTWRLTISSTYVQGAVGGAFMAADYVNSTAVYRLFGDGNGDRTVDTTDYNAFGGAYGLSNPDPGYVLAAASGFDWNNDGTIDSTDFDRFGANLGLTL